MIRIYFSSSNDDVPLFWKLELVFINEFIILFFIRYCLNRKQLDTFPFLYTLIVLCEIETCIFYVFRDLFSIGYCLSRKYIAIFLPLPLLPTTISRWTRIFYEFNDCKFVLHLNINSNWKLSRFSSSSFFFFFQLLLDLRIF